MSPRTIAIVMLFAAVCFTVPFVEAGQAGGSPSVAVDYRAPVPGPVVDPFRPPATPYAPGNRGLDYRTTPGQPVEAAGPGNVIFAGPVASRLVVVLLHDDGLRTSYTGLTSIAVRRNEHVAAGQVIGRAGEALQFGVRAGRAYLDPAVLLDASRGRTAHLVPVSGP